MSIRLSQCFTYVKPSKKQPHWTAHFGDITGTGESQEAAEAAVMVQVRAIVEGDFTPMSLIFHGVMGVVWHEPIGGWMYALRTALEAFPIEGEHYRVNTVGGYECQVECERAMRKHLAQYVLCSGMIPGDDVVEASLCIREERDRLDFIRREEEGQELLAFAKAQDLPFYLAQQVTAGFLTLDRAHAMVEAQRKVS